MIKAVIFDMFETLVTHFESPLYMGKQITNDIGIAEQKFREIWDTSDDDRTLGKRTFEDVIEEVLKVNNCYSDELFEKIIAKRRRSKIECFEHIHPEILPLFNRLKERDIKIGLITNCYFEESDVIRKSVFFDYFDSVCMSCEVGIKKPDVGIFQMCMKELSVAPEECLYIGDGGSFELETARVLGMHPLQATWYLKDGANQPAKRKMEFLQADNPLDVCLYMNEFKRVYMEKDMVKKATINESRILAEMAVQMWDSHTVDELEIEFTETLKGQSVVFFIKYVEDIPVAFAQCGLRTDYVEGTESSPVGYLEGIFVKADYRNKGYARELSLACEKWAKDMGCREFASDCKLDNVNSLKFHMAMGFKEANRIICFRKDI